jgi:Tat protein translocase TatB subunit
MFGLGFGELVLILLVALIVLGPKKLPDLARTLGKGLRELRHASEDLRSTIIEPLEQVRKPLQDMRDDLVETIHKVGRDIEHEASVDTTQTRPADPDLALPEAEAKEIEDRRLKVEEMYATAADGDTPRGTEPARVSTSPETSAQSSDATDEPPKS